MLVLSRKQNQAVVFPNLGIQLEILRINGNTVRVGIDAPRDVNILRGELADKQPENDGSAAERKRRHDLRNQLNTASLALHLLKTQLQRGQSEGAEETLCKALETLYRLDAELDPPKIQSLPKRSPRALIVEDNDNERELMSGFLGCYGYHVESVQDGSEAMSYLATHHLPDLVLLDMQMPRMNGPETISAIRCDARYNGMKVFAVSGSEPGELGVSVGDRGVDRWFAKPLKPTEFAKQLEAELTNTITGTVAARH